MRNDIDNKLTHLVRLDLSKSDPWKHARESLKAILSSGSLTAQKHPAVPVASISFSEAPIYQLALGIASNSRPRNRAPYGVMVSIESLFKNGGLPVIYQPRALAKALPENQQRIYDSADTPEEHMQNILESFITLNKRFSDDKNAIKIIQRETALANKWIAETESPEPKIAPRTLGTVEPSEKKHGSRSIFDDIDDGEA